MSIFWKLMLSEKAELWKILFARLRNSEKPEQQLNHNIQWELGDLVCLVQARL